MKIFQAINLNFFHIYQAFIAQGVFIHISLYQQRMNVCVCVCVKKIQMKNKKLKKNVKVKNNNNNSIFLYKIRRRKKLFSVYIAKNYVIIHFEFQMAES